MRTFLSFLLLLSSLGAAERWTFDADGDVKWSRITRSGLYLYGTGKSLSALDPTTGKQIWTRPDLADTQDYLVDEIEETPLLLITKNSGVMKQEGRVTAISSETGQDAWQTDAIKGQVVEVLLKPNSTQLILFISAFNAAKAKIDVMGMDLATGAVQFQVPLGDSADLYPFQNKKKGGFSGFKIPRLDLNGHAAPTFDGDDLYIAYCGLHKVNTKTGKLEWKLAFDVTEKTYKNTNASPLLVGELVISSAKGVLRAFDKSTGQLKWTSPDFGAAIPELTALNGTIFARMGGTFWEVNKGEYVTKKPVGVLSLEAATGALKWRYDDARESLTNLVVDTATQSIVTADTRQLIGLDLSGSGKVKAAYTIPLEFKLKQSAAKKTAKVAAKFAMGRMQAFGKKTKDSENPELDPPLAIARRESGAVVVRGKQHVLAFDPGAKKVAWGTELKAPGLSGWQQFAAVSAFAMSYAMNYASASGSQAGSFTNRQANANIVRDIDSFYKRMDKRYANAKASSGFAYMLTDVEDDDGTGPGVVSVSLDTGEVTSQIYLKDRDIVFDVDDFSGVVIHHKKDSKTLQGGKLN